MSAKDVQESMEAMVPELLDLKANKIFSEEEVYDIVRNRKKFEFKIASRSCEKSDFLQYIKFVVKTEAERRRRVKARRIRKSMRSAKEPIRLLHSVFNKALGKYKGDKALWYQYLDFCLSAGSTRALSGAVMRALRFFARDEGLWILAADREMKLGRVDSCRALLQRGLRNNPSSVKLFAEHFRFECIAAQRMSEARLVAAGGEPPATTSCKVMQIIFTQAIARLDDAGRATFLADVVEILDALRSTEESKHMDGLSELCDQAQLIAAEKMWNGKKLMHYKFNQEPDAFRWVDEALSREETHILSFLGWLQKQDSQDMCIKALRRMANDSRLVRFPIPVKEVATVLLMEGSEQSISDCGAMLKIACSQHPIDVPLHVLQWRIARLSTDVTNDVLAFFQQKEIRETASADDCAVIFAIATWQKCDTDVVHRLLVAIMHGAMASAVQPLVDSYVSYLVANPVLAPRAPDVLQQLAVACRKREGLLAYVSDEVLAMVRLAAGANAIRLILSSPAPDVASGLWWFEQGLEGLDSVTETVRCQWYLRYMGFVRWVNQSGMMAPVSMPTVDKLHWRATRAVEDQERYLALYHEFTQ
mmetsp:Transcript_21846/g.53762  ORF Transcript_21846/g.53762 Transcript_21846/m.53762 type:complete len:590 (+) Transcript_21846:76-1845(+)